MDTHGEWQIVQREDETTLEWWSPRSQKVGAVMGVRAPIGLEQWSLVKKQFENMGIVPRVDQA
jgi:hypothetical protein